MIYVRYDDLDEVDVDLAQEWLDELSAAGVHGTIAATKRTTGVLGGPEMVEAISLGALQLAGAAVLVERILARLRRAVVVDLTGDDPEIRPDRSLPRGSVLLRHADGTTELLDPGDGIASKIAGAVAGGGKG